MGLFLDLGLVFVKIDFANFGSLPWEKGRSQEVVQPTNTNREASENKNTNKSVFDVKDKRNRGISRFFRCFFPVLSWCIFFGSKMDELGQD